MSSDTEETVQTSGPPRYAQPYAEEYLQRAGDLSRYPQEFLPSGSERIAGLSPEQALALSMGGQRGALGSPVMGAANSSLMDLMGGAFSPLTNRLVEQSNRSNIDAFNTQITPNVAAQFNRANTLGSTGHAEMEAINRYNLSRAMGENENSIRNAALNRSLQAISQAPGLAQQDWFDINSLMQLGGVDRGIAQAVLDSDLARFLDIRDEPYRRLDALGRAIGTSGGSYTTTSNPSGNNYVAGLGALGSLAGGLGSLFGAL